ncbi:MAG TPA: LOG family protein [Chloroflexia bacterium]|nr:LOG family protein [Chloroflexia bacterium]
MTAAPAPRISVFGAAHGAPGDPDYELARRLGRLLAEAGYPVCTGGYGGMMAAVSRGAREAGGTVVGVTLAGGSDGRTPNRWLTQEIPTDSLHARLAELLASQACVAVNGGVGTLAEVALGWALLQKETGARKPLILIGPRWQRTIAALTGTLAITPGDVALLTLVETPEEVLAVLRARIAEAPSPECTLEDHAPWLTS